MSKAFPTLLMFLIAAGACAAPLHHNPAEPPGGTDALELEALWTVGGADDEENIFGVITQVLVDDAGQVYLLDQQLSTVSVFSPEGELVRTLGREGDGPGETRSPNDMVFFPDGTLGLVQVFPGKIVKLHLDGSPAGEFPYALENASTGAGFGVLLLARVAGGTIALAGVDQTFAGGMLDQTYFLSCFDMEGAETARYAEKKTQLNFAAMVLDEGEVDFPWSRFDLGEDGRVVVAPEREEYRIDVYGPDGELALSFDRPHESWNRTAEDLDRANKLLEAQGRNYPSMPEIRILDTEPAVNRLQVMPDGTIWVETNRSQRELDDGVMMRWDVFTAEGVYERRVEIVADGDSRRDLLFLVDDGHALLVKDFWRTIIDSGDEAEGGDEAEPMSLTYCRLRG